MPAFIPEMIAGAEMTGQIFDANHGSSDAFQDIPPSDPVRSLMKGSGFFGTCMD